MRNSLLSSVAALVALLAGLSTMRAQTKVPPGQAIAQIRGGIPDLSGNWVGSPPSFSITDPQGRKVGTPEDDTPYQPWALAKLNSERPGYGLHATFDDVTDPRIKYCDPIGIPRVFLVPNQFKFVQTPEYVYILFETGTYWIQVAMNREHPKDPDPTWWGDSIGRYEGDTLVVDSVGFNDKTWLDHLGRPHSEALHLVERFRRLDHETLELNITFDDPQAYTRTFAGRKILKLSPREFVDYSCSYSENQHLNDSMINGIVKPPSK